jgi:hypothetical protein
LEKFFDGWRDYLTTARKYLPAPRGYAAARLWSQVGLRIGETRRLDMTDVLWEAGPQGKLHVRFGKGSRRRGPKQRITPLINGPRPLLEWFVTDVRGQFDDRWDEPGAPLLCSERKTSDGDGCRVSAETLRVGLAQAVARHLPAWRGRLSPHVLRHHCASSLYRDGVDIVAIQELLGHEWIATTMGYVHVNGTHIEDSWTRAADRELELGQERRGNYQAPGPARSVRRPYVYGFATSRVGARVTLGGFLPGCPKDQRNQCRDRQNRNNDDEDDIGDRSVQLDGGCVRVHCRRRCRGHASSLRRCG